MIEAGTMRKSNVQNILTKNLLVICAGAGFLDSPRMREWFFQGAFCATAGTIVS